MVLRMLDVEILLNQASPATRKGATPSVKVTRKHPSTAKAAGQKTSKTPGAVAIRKTKPSAVVKAGRIFAPTKKKESW